MNAPPKRSGGPGIMEFAGLGLMNAICLLAGLGVGWLVDSALGTLPVFLFLGLVVGITVGALASRVQLRRW